MGSLKPTKRQEQAVKAFMNGEQAAIVHIRIDERGDLYDYTTCIATRVDDTLVVNMRKYSDTTTRLQTALCDALEAAGVNYSLIVQFDLERGVTAQQLAELYRNGQISK